MIAIFSLLALITALPLITTEILAKSASVTVVADWDEAIVNWTDLGKSQKAQLTYPYDLKDRVKVDDEWYRRLGDIHFTDEDPGPYHALTIIRSSWGYSKTCWFNLAKDGDGNEKDLGSDPVYIKFEGDEDVEVTRNGKECEEVEVECKI